MKVALAQLNYIIGDVEGNSRKIIDCIKQHTGKADILVFSELAVSGYPPQDLLTYPSFLDRCEAALRDIASHCIDIAVIVGCPTRSNSTRGKALFNSACFLAEGALQFTQQKSLLPDYDIFDEYRYFEPFSEPKMLEYKGKKIAIAICEDIWEVGTPSLYKRQPLEFEALQGADFLINIAASPFNHNQAALRRTVLRKNAQRYNLPVYYVNHVGAQTDLIFDGGSLYCNALGDIVHELAYFEEEIRVIEPETLTVQPEYSRLERMEKALVLGIRDFFQKQGFTKAILGLSGGIDSALTATLAVKALGAENVMGVLMPSAYSSDHSIKDAEDLARNLGCLSMKLPIGDAFDSYIEILKPAFEGTKPGLAEENLQARVRGTLLMAMSNKLGFILLNTTNKSEAAVGYGTLYGDLCGGLSVLADVYKTEVFELSRFQNRDRELIPTNSIVKPPSAELRPDQKDSDSLPEYPQLDSILLQYIEGVKSKEEIIKSGQPEEVVEKVIRLVNMNEYKRFQTAPILRVSQKGFGYGRKMPLVGKI